MISTRITAQEMARAMFRTTLQAMLWAVIGMMSLLNVACGPSLPSMDEAAVDNSSTEQPKGDDLFSGQVNPGESTAPRGVSNMVNRINNMNLVTNGDFSAGVSNFKEVGDGSLGTWVRFEGNAANKTTWSLTQSTTGAALVISCSIQPCASNLVYLDIPRPAVAAGTVVRFGASIRGLSGKTTGQVALQQLNQDRTVAVATAAVNFVGYAAGFDKVSQQTTLAGADTPYLRLLLVVGEGQLVIDDVWLEY
jgi:hypothetical protein